RSYTQSARKCQIREHSARRGIAPCARDPKKAVADIHQAPSSPPVPCQQLHTRSRESALPVQPDSPFAALREPCPSQVQIARRRSPSPPPASPEVLLKTPSPTAPVL